MILRSRPSSALRNGDGRAVRSIQKPRVRPIEECRTERRSEPSESPRLSPSGSSALTARGTVRPIHRIPHMSGFLLDIPHPALPRMHRDCLGNGFPERSVRISRDCSMGHSRFLCPVISSVRSAVYYHSSAFAEKTTEQAAYPKQHIHQRYHIYSKQTARRSTRD